MKAEQYFRQTFDKKQYSTQKDLEASSYEIKHLRQQMEKLTWKTNDIIAENRMLKKELKTAHMRAEEREPMVLKMKEQIFELKQKNEHYKDKCLKMKEMLKDERVENENNMLSLKKLLSKYFHV